MSCWASYIITHRELTSVGYRCELTLVGTQQELTHAEVNCGNLGVGMSNFKRKMSKIHVIFVWFHQTSLMTQNYIW